MAGDEERLEIHLLGGFSLSYDGTQLPPLPSRHARLLFAWLALRSGRPQSRTLLADRFWPDLPESRGRRRLSHALWQIQDSLGESTTARAYVVTRGDDVAFDVDAPSWLDVEEFEHRLDLVDRGPTVDAAGVRHLRRALQLYRGDLLAGSYEDWVLLEQERLRQRYVDALQRLATACEQRGNFDEALTVARRLTHEAPMREDAHRTVMRLCVLVGQPHQAMEQFERCRSVLAEELGASPSPETVQLYDSIAHGRTTSTARAPTPAELESRSLIGRDDERVHLVDRLELTLSGQSATVFVEGEPGVGKTHLLAQVAEDARWRGFTVVWGDCDGHDAPFAWLREALSPLLNHVRVSQLAAVVAPVWLQDAAMLLPTLRDALGEDQPRPAPLAGADGAERMRQALVHVITGLATLDPVLLVLDDVHGADEDTLGLLRSLARHPSPGRLMLTLSFRDVESRERADVWSALRTLDRDARPSRLVLRPLSPFETGALLRDALVMRHVPAGFVERVQRETGGNPLYVMELLRALRDEGELDDPTEDHLDRLAVPMTRGVRTLIANRLALLSEPAEAVIEQAAVLGGEFPLAVLAASVSLSDRQRTVALGELVRRNLLQVDDEVVTFTNAATRTVLLGRISEDRRRSLHAAAATAIEEHAPRDAEALARHLLVADPRRAVVPLRQAADRALEVHAMARAASHLTTAIRIGERTPMTVDDRIELLLTAEHVLDVLGRREDQAEVLDRLEALDCPDARHEVERTVRRATLLVHTDRLDEATAVAEEAVERARAAADDQLLVRALTVRGDAAVWLGDREGAVTVLQEAAALETADAAGRSHALRALGRSLRFLQRYDEAAEALRDARAAAEESGDTAALVRALAGLADVDAETGRTTLAAGLHERAVALARRVGYRHGEGVSLVNLATIRLTNSQPGPALDAYDQAEQVFAALGAARGVAMVQLNRAWLLHRWIGDDDAARSDAEAARSHFDSTGNVSMAAVASETLAGIARRSGDLERAGHLLDTMQDAAVAAGDRRAVVQLLRGRAELAYTVGDMKRLAEVADDALVRAARLELREFEPELASMSAMAHASIGATDQAAERAATAARTVAASAEPHLVHHRLATTARSLDDDETAALHARRAGELLDSALGGLDEDRRAEVLAALPHFATIEAEAAPHLPRRFHLELARHDAPRGRPLDADERVQVVLELPPLPRDPTTRRDQLLHLLGQVERAGATATVRDLSSALEVSPSTVRRDLRALRDAGHDVRTRGTGTG